MHGIYFIQKQAHLGAVAKGRAMFRHLQDMTPARFDLMYVIYTAGHSLLETDVRERLGLTRQTVWETITRLIELGFLEKTKSEAGRRRNTVFFTEGGLRRFRLALNAAFSERRPLPAAAPAPASPEEDAPRWWRRPELADPVTPEGTPVTASGLIIGPNGVPTAAMACEPQMLGREVEKIYTSWAWKMMRDKSTRRGRRVRHLLQLEWILEFFYWAAHIVGSKTSSIYKFQWDVPRDHEHGHEFD